MGLLTRLSLRNLFRQKRRNIFLGSAIAFGMSILIVANGFSHGISDTLLNKIIVFVAGQMEVAVVENGRFRSPIIRDRSAMLSLITNNVSDIIETFDNLGVMCRGIGNGKSDLMYIVGIDLKNGSMSDDQRNYFSLIRGTYADYHDQSKTNPIILTESKAKALGVTVNDQVRIRLQTIYGQSQTAILTVVGLLRSKNAYMDFAVYLNKADTKALLGLREQETGSLQIVLKNPKSAIAQANTLHHALTSNIAVMPAHINAITQNWVLCLKQKHHRATVSSNTAWIPESMAQTLHLVTGNRFTLTHYSRFENAPISWNLTVSRIYDNAILKLPEGSILVPDQSFYKEYYANIPSLIAKKDKIWSTLKQSPFAKNLGSDFEILPRSRTTKEFTKRMKDLNNEKSGVAYIDVRTMYETASAIVKMEQVLNMVTMIAVLVLFFIILIGVINTLRMTIRERTREIGTTRAIGMQRGDVLKTFILETLFLSLFSTTAGVILGLIVIVGLGSITIQTESFFSILLVNKHLHFVINPITVVLNMALIVTIAVLTAYFPARRAAKISAAEALRHFE